MVSVSMLDDIFEKKKKKADGFCHTVKTQLILFSILDLNFTIFLQEIYT